MKITNLNYDYFRSNSYLLEHNNKFYLIDPSVEVKVLKQYTSHLDGILITHAHIDHIMNLKEIENEFRAPVYCHKNAIAKIEDNDLNCARIFGFEKDLKIEEYHIVHEGDKIDDLFKVLETPGHTNCSVIYLIQNIDNQNIMFSGDTLFKESVGRTDLYSGSMGALRKSLIKIASLKMNYVIYPGHDLFTTLNEEKVNNEYLNLK